MRAIVFHRRAARYLSRMPCDRAIQVRDALREVLDRSRRLRAGATAHDLHQARHLPFNNPREEIFSEI
jgi:hypothetical protein